MEGESRSRPERSAALSLTVCLLPSPPSSPLNQVRGSSVVTLSRPQNLPMPLREHPSIYPCIHLSIYLHRSTPPPPAPQGCWGSLSQLCWGEGGIARRPRQVFLTLTFELKENPGLCITVDIGAPIDFSYVDQVEPCRRYTMLTHATTFSKGYFIERLFVFAVADVVAVPHFKMFVVFFLNYT